MKLSRCLAAFLLLAGCLAWSQSAPPSVDSYESRTKVGDAMPQFSITSTDGETISIQDLKGKVVLVNFWATWCGPCRAELPRLEQEVWRAYKSSKFVMVGIAREQTQAEIVKALPKLGVTYPLAADPTRNVYKRFANAGIPRSYVIGTDGSILFQSVGYDPEEFNQMKRIIKRELSKAQ